MGVFLAGGWRLFPEGGLPHARGGVSSYFITFHGPILSSPRTWGCFQVPPDDRVLSGVFPTHVGVFLFSCHAQLPKNCLPHARGGVSMVSPAVMLCSSSSPHTWGCFFMNSKFMGMVYVFPTHVGVFPKEERDQWRERRLPHARGGVSAVGGVSSSDRRSSPRTWGCFSRKA